MPRVLITPIYLQGVDGPFCEVLQEAGLEPCFAADAADLRHPLALIEQLAGIDAVLASIEPYSVDVLEASKLRVIARCGVGYDSVDVAAATRRGILVTNTPGANKEGVAEHAIALMLAVAHGFPRRDREVRAGRWARHAMPRLAGQTVGLVGLGAIGREVALRCQVLGTTVIATDPAGDETWAAKHGVELVSFDQLLSRADVVSLHLPCTDKTTRLFGAAAFAQMKRGAVLINTARGGLVDEAALVAALESGKLSGAGLDVFDQEPLPADHPLTTIDTALLCPHMGGLDLQSRDAMATLAADSIAQLYQGRWPEGRVVNAESAGSWKW
jgi:D-3-phosphoglycerate dehydrogenase/(S)-sulfolactate dehydrogenase